jgi:hypothetical protein
MTNEQPEHTRADDAPAAFYKLIKSQTETTAGHGGAAGLVGALTFAAVAIILVVAIEVGVDLQALLAGIVGLAAINVILALVYSSRSARNR